MICISCHFRPLKPLTLRMDCAKVLDILTSLAVSHAILPHAVYASGPIRRCLFIDYIIKENVIQMNLKAIIPNVYISSISYCIKIHKASLLSNVKETCSCKIPCPDHQID